MCKYSEENTKTVIQDPVIALVFVAISYSRVVVFFLLTKCY